MTATMKKGIDFRAVGRNRYKDNQGNTLINDPKKDVLYIVGEDSLKKFHLLDSRYLIGVILAVVLGNSIGYGWSLLIAIAVTGTMEYLFRFRFLNTLTRIEGAGIPATPSLYERLLKSSFAGNFGRFLLSCVIPFVLFFVLKRQAKGRSIFSVSSVNDVVMIGMCVLIFAYDMYMLVASFKASWYQYNHGMTGKKNG